MVWRKRTIPLQQSRPPASRTRRGVPRGCEPRYSVASYRWGYTSPPGLVQERAPVLVRPRESRLRSGWPRTRTAPNSPGGPHDADGDMSARPRSRWRCAVPPESRRNADQGHPSAADCRTIPPPHCRHMTQCCPSTPHGQGRRALGAVCCLDIATLYPISHDALSSGGGRCAHPAVRFAG